MKRFKTFSVIMILLIAVLHTAFSINIPDPHSFQEIQTQGKINQNLILGNWNNSYPIASTQGVLIGQFKDAESDPTFFIVVENHPIDDNSGSPNVTISSNLTLTGKKYKDEIKYSLALCKYMVKWTDMLDYGKRKYFKTLHSIELPYNRTEESRNVGRAIILYIPADQDPKQKYKDTYTGKINNTSVTFENPNGVVPYLKASFDTTDVNVNLSSLTAITKITTLNIESNIHKTSIATAPSVTLKPGSGANVTSDGSFRFIHSSPSVKNTYAYTVSAVKQGQGAPVGPGNGGQFKLSADGLSAGSTTDWGASYDIYIKLDDNQTKVSEAPAGDYISYITVTEDSI